MIKIQGVDAQERKHLYDGLSDYYEQARPTYPKELFDTILKYWQKTKSPLEKPLTMLDVTRLYVGRK